VEGNAAEQSTGQASVDRQFLNLRKMDKRIMIGAAIAAVIAIAAVVLMTAPRQGGIVGCTEEAKICPDGSAVGRVAPTCEFAPCPGTGPLPLPPITGNADDTGATPSGIMTVVDANNQFAFEMYSKLNSEPENAGKNLFFSPYSISTALAMTYEGAVGQTANEMATVFHFPTDAGVRRSAYARIYNSLNAPGGTSELSTANALWAQKDYSFLDSYFSTVGKYYMGNVTNLDFIAKTEESRITINKWVEAQTKNRIVDLIPQGILTPMTRLVLTNAIYFKGKWATQFKPDNTHDGDFRVSGSKTVTAKMMSLSGTSFNYTEDGLMQVLELPYDGNDLSMLVLLPKGDDISSMEASLTAEKLSQIKSGLRETELPVTLPKFKFETKSFLAEILKAMGMPTAFDPNSADFSGMNGALPGTEESLYISAVIHQAFVEVNEEGTEAAAATAVIMTKATAVMPSVIFTADHPFIFLIQEKSTGEILFLGKVTDPTAAN
jgi:serpin B